MAETHYCLCGSPRDTPLSPYCDDCRIDPARLNTVSALRAEVDRLVEERDAAVENAQRWERTAGHWRRSFYNRTAPGVFQIGVAP